MSLPTEQSAFAVHALSGLSGEPFDVPGGSMPVEATTLNLEPGGGRTMLVRFPVGWERLARGSYEAAEEFYVIEGRIEMSGLVVGAGEWARFPAGFERHETRTPVGAVALARFDGVPRWHVHGDAT